MSLRVLFLLRTFSHISVWMWSLIVPLIIFRTSGSIGLAGLTTAIEWIPRLFYSFYTGRVTVKLGIKKTLISAQVAKITSLSIAMGIYNHRESIPGELIAIVLGLAGALIQLSNTQDRNDFEILGHTMIDAKTLASHTAIIKACYFAGVITGILALSFSGAILFWGATGLVTSSLTVVGYVRHLKNSKRVVSDHQISHKNFREDLRDFFLSSKIRAIYLFMTAKSSLSGFFALAVVFVAKDFRLETIGLKDEDIVSLRPVAAILTVLAITGFGRFMSNNEETKEGKILVLSSLGFAISLSIIIFSKTAIALLGALILSEIASAFITIMIIEKRQNLFPVQQRENFTAIMSTSAPVSYIIGGVYMGILEKKLFSLDTLIIIALVIMASAMVSVLREDYTSIEESSREVLSKAS